MQPLPKRKRLVYARAGVKELRLVDPLLSQIQRYDFARDTAKPVQLIEEDETFSTPLLPVWRSRRRRFPGGEWWLTRPAAA